MEACLFSLLIKRECPLRNKRFDPKPFNCSPILSETTQLISFCLFVHFFSCAIHRRKVNLMNKGHGNNPKFLDRTRMRELSLAVFSSRLDQIATACSAFHHQLLSRVPVCLTFWLLQSVEL